MSRTRNSRRPKGSPHSRRPRSRNGGRSSRRRASRRSEQRRRPRSVPPPPLFLRRLARRIACIARGLLLGQQCGVLLFLFGLQRRHDGRLFGGNLGSLLGGFLRRLRVGFSLEPGGLGAGSFVGGLLTRARFLALAARFGDRLQLCLLLFICRIARLRGGTKALQQGLLGFRSSVEALLRAGAFRAAPHSSALLRLTSRPRQARSAHVG